MLVSISDRQTSFSLKRHDNQEQAGNIDVIWSR